MNKQIFKAHVDGFASGDSDFPLALQNSIQSVQDDFGNLVNAISDLVNSPASADQSGVLLIVGHADRDDTPGLTHVQARDNEVRASPDRAFSARDEVDRLIEALTNLPTASSGTDQFQAFVDGDGSASLFNFAAVIPANDRPKNRSVDLRFVKFIP